MVAPNRRSGAGPEGNDPLVETDGGQMPFHSGPFPSSPQTATFLQSRHALKAPAGSLDDHAIAIWVFERATGAIPIRIECPHGHKPGILHSINCRLPFGWFRQVEY